MTVFVPVAVMCLMAGGDPSECRVYIGDHHPTIEACKAQVRNADEAIKQNPAYIALGKHVFINSGCSTEEDTVDDNTAKSRWFRTFGPKTGRDL